MCFSASVSFAASAVLLPTGVYALRSAYQCNPMYRSLATIPIAFALQQACEGMVWLGIQTEALVTVRFGALGFLAFAYWFWLFWSPWSVANTEPAPAIRRISWVFSLLGCFYGTLLYLPLFVQPDWLSVQVMHHSILYNTRLIFDPWVSQQFDRLIYALIILIPFALATNPALKVFGAAICFSAIAAQWLHNEVFVSVWCFFAAMLSVGILYICRTAPPTDAIAK